MGGSNMGVKPGTQTPPPRPKTVRSFQDLGPLTAGEALPPVFRVLVEGFAVPPLPYPFGGLGWPCPARGRLCQRPARHAEKHAGRALESDTQENMKNGKSGDLLHKVGRQLAMTSPERCIGEEKALPQTNSGMIS